MLPRSPSRHLPASVISLTGKFAVVVYFKVIFIHSPGENGETEIKPSVSWPMVELQFPNASQTDLINLLCPVFSSAAQFVPFCL
jgi:hypothetical protein